jgi:hypothetical protein
MNVPFTEIVDLGHEMFHDMPNIGGAQVAFWPISTVVVAQSSNLAGSRYLHGAADVQSGLPGR